MSDNVYIIGAGFSAGLGYPLLRNLLEYVWDDISQDDKKVITKVVKFHNPNFEPNHPFTFPDIETLLTQFEANIELFDYTREKEGRFKKEKLIAARDTLLIEMAKKFHQTNQAVNTKKYPWLNEFKKRVTRNASTIISFNYDLVIENLLFGKDLNPACYGFNIDQSNLSILKPHGSLNWFKQNENTGRLKKEKTTKLLSNDDVVMFKLPRHPKSKFGNTYVPHLIPPTFAKKFAGEIYQTTLKNSVSAISKAKNVYFLGCSLPKSDFHSQFMIRCGLHNQVDGEIATQDERTQPVGAANIYVINPDQLAAKNTMNLVGRDHKFIWKNMTVADWVKEGLTP